MKFMYNLEETEPIFVHGAQELMPPAYIDWQSGTTKEIGLSYRPVRLELIPGLLRRFTNTGSGVRRGCQRPREMPEP
jgi:hypothetical protein